MKENGGIVIGHLSISYDRGIARNKPEDVGLPDMPEETGDGGIVRGLGSHWRSKEDRDLVKARSNEENRIRNAFSRAFVRAPFEGTFIQNERGEGQTFLYQLDPPVRADVQVSVAEYVLGVVTQTPEDVRDWSDRVMRQLRAVPLGRGSKVSDEGLAALARLVDCPIIDEQSRDVLRGLIEDARLELVDRVDFKRRLAKVQVEVGVEKVEPRRPIRPAMVG
jgi:hypothetical protein